MFQLIYSSAPRDGLQPSEAKSIAAQSKANNENAGITGVLLMSSSTTLQILEGEKSTVEALYERIKSDTRHTDCDLLLTRHCHTREFPNFAMGYQSPEDEYEIKLAIVALKARRRAREREQQIAS